MTGRAETPDAKRAIVERLLAAWLAKPTLRLGQLLHHAHAMTPEPKPNFGNVEDEVLAAEVDRYAGLRTACHMIGDEPCPRESVAWDRRGWGFCAEHKGDL